MTWQIQYPSWIWWTIMGKKWVIYLTFLHFQVKRSSFVPCYLLNLFLLAFLFIGLPSLCQCSVNHITDWKHPEGRNYFKKDHKIPNSWLMCPVDAGCLMTIQLWWLKRILPLALEKQIRQEETFLVNITVFIWRKGVLESIH